MFCLDHSPAVLPCLPALGRSSPQEKQVLVRDYDTYYFEDIKQLHGIGAKNQQSLTELLVCASYRFQIAD